MYVASSYYETIRFLAKNIFPGKITLDEDAR